LKRKTYSNFNIFFKGETKTLLFLEKNLYKIEEISGNNLSREGNLTKESERKFFKTFARLPALNLLWDFA
jgi:hypothetical protein